MKKLLMLIAFFGFITVAANAQCHSSTTSKEEGKATTVSAQKEAKACCSKEEKGTKVKAEIKTAEGKAVKPASADSKKEDCTKGCCEGKAECTKACCEGKANGKAMKATVTPTPEKATKGEVETEAKTKACCAKGEKGKTCSKKTDKSKE